jgi:hypothetical protein
MFTYSVFAGLFNYGQGSNLSQILFENFPVAHLCELPAPSQHFTHVAVGIVRLQTKGHGVCLFVCAVCSPP